MKINLFFGIWLTAHMIGLAQEKPVFICGTSKDSSINKILLINSSVYFDSKASVPNALCEGTKGAEDSFLLKTIIKHSQWATIDVIGDNWDIFLTPGDSVSFVVSKTTDSRGKLIRTIFFEGKNADQYNFYSKLDKLIRVGLDDVPKFQKNIQTYKLQVDNIYKRKIQFLNDYVIKYNVSPAFVKQVRADIDYRMCLSLYQPLRVDEIRLNELPSGYFSNADTLVWDDDNLLDVEMFRGALRHKYIYSKPNRWENFDKILSNIIKKTNGKIKEFLICSMINIYIEKQLLDYKDSLAKLISKAGKYLKDTLFIHQLAKSKMTYEELYSKKFDHVFPQNVLTSALKDFNSGKTVSFADILKLHEGKMIYLDFWASWCGACRVDMSKAAKAKEFLKSKNISIVYVSIDKDEATWRKATDEENIADQQYLLEGVASSPLKKYLSLTFIPKYVFLDSHHRIKSIDAPRINEVEYEELRSIILKYTSKVVRY